MRLKRVDPRVDYAALEQALAEAGELFPGATKLVPLLANALPAVEVWTGNRASIYVPVRSR